MRCLVIPTASVKRLEGYYLHLDQSQYLNL